MIAAGAKDILPELLALARRPAIGALVYWDLELRRIFQEVKEVSFRCFHGIPSFLLILGDERTSKSMQSQIQQN